MPEQKNRKSQTTFFVAFVQWIYGVFKQVVRPFSVIKYHGMSFFLWCMFTLIGGLLGILVSVAKSIWFEPKLSLSQALYIESANGAFYTYSIAIVAAVLSSVFIVFSEKKDLGYRRYQITLIAFSIFLLLFGGVFYALSKDSSSLNISDIPSKETIVIEWKQLIVFILSILFSLYSFCVCRLDEHNEVFSDISDDRLKNAKPEESFIDVDTKN